MQRRTKNRGHIALLAFLLALVTLGPAPLTQNTAFAQTASDRDARQNMQKVRQRRDVRDLPAPLRDRLVEIAGRPNTFSLQERSESTSLRTVRNLTSSDTFDRFYTPLHFVQNDIRLSGSNPTILVVETPIIGNEAHIVRRRTFQLSGLFR